MSEGKPPLWVAAVACSALFLVILDNTIVNVAIVPIAHALRAEVHTLHWVVGAYFLAQAAVIPVAGYLAVRYGTRRLFLWSLGTFVLASGLCGIAESAFELIAFRVLQGLGGGALYPLAQSIAFGAYSGQSRVKGISLTMVPGVLAPTLGPLSGGYLTVHYGWSAIFLINVPLGLLFLFLASLWLPKDEPIVVESRFDTGGLLTCLVGVVAITYGFSLVGTPLEGSLDELHPEGEPHGWSHPWTLGALGLGALMLLAFIRSARGAREPVLDLRLLERREFRIAVTIASLNNAVFFGSMLMLPLFLIRVRQPALSALDVGLVLGPQGLGSALMLLVLPRLRRTVSPGVLVAMGSGFLALSSLGLAEVATGSSAIAIVPWIFLRGMGFGTAFQITQAMAVMGLTRTELAHATSLFSVLRQISSSVGLALMISLFGSWASSNIRAFRLAEPKAQLTALALRAEYAAFETLFLSLAAVSFIGVLLALFLTAPARLRVASGAGQGALSSPLAKPEALS